MQDAAIPHPPEAEALDDLFACLGRSLLLLDGVLRVVRVSGGGAAGRCAGADGGAAANGLEGCSVTELFPGGVFDEGGPLLRAVAAGTPRHGWRAPYVGRAGGCLVELSAAAVPRQVATRLGAPQAVYALLMRRLPAADGACEPLVYHRMAARSHAMCRIFRRCDELGPRSVPVLLEGELGTGKELVARALHAASPRAAGPFVAVNCAALPDSLVESELIGHRRHAFPGALQDRLGRFEAAAGGTLFLDRVGALDHAVQRRVLAVLREGVFRRLGEETPRRFEARLVAAWDADLHLAVAQGRFDADLFAELGRETLCLPPLRRRVEDVEPLAVHFLARAAARDGVAWELSSQTLGLLLRSSWPGNVRELENALQHACTVATPPRIEPDDLPSELLFDVTEAEPAAAEAWACGRGGAVEAGAGEAGAEGAAAGEASGDATAKLLAALERHGWRRRETADALGVDRAAFWRRLWELGWVR